MPTFCTPAPPFAHQSVTPQPAAAPRRQMPPPAWGPQGSATARRPQWGKPRHAPYCSPEQAVRRRGTAHTAARNATCSTGHTATGGKDAGQGTKAEKEKNLECGAYAAFQMEDMWAGTLISGNAGTDVSLTSCVKRAMPFLQRCYNYLRVQRFIYTMCLSDKYIILRQKQLIRYNRNKAAACM